MRISVGGAPAALAFGGGSLWVADSDSREVAQIDPGANKVAAADRGRQRATLAGLRRRRGVGRVGSRWAHPRIDLATRPRQRIDPRGREPVRDRGRRRRAVGGERGVRDGDADRPADRERPAADPRRQRAERARVRRGRGLGRQPPRRDAVADRSRDERGVVGGRGGQRPDRGGGRGRARCGWRAARTAPSLAWTRTGRARRSDSRPGAVRRRSRWPAARCGRRRTPRRPRTGVGRCACASHTRPRRRSCSTSCTGLSYTTSATAQLDSLAYDGLVAYRRVAGAGRPHARRRPRHDGAGAERRRQDLRLHAAARAALLRREAGAADRLQGLDGALPGGHSRLPPSWASRRRMPASSALGGACGGGRACDLSRGIETDVPARTITIHLSRPDGDLLHKLTMHFASVVPAGSPRRPTMGLTPPGTGPYRAVAWDAHRGGTFVRNRYFRSEPGRARAARASRIASRSGCTARRRSSGRSRAVQRGDADLAVLADPFGPLVSARRLRGAGRPRSPGRVHSAPAATTDWVFLNTRQRPFDDLGVRRARQLRDRPCQGRRALGRAGGRRADLPGRARRLPGQRAVLPATQPRPTKGGGWTAPDMERARRLVAASGRAGEHVIVRVPDFREAVGRHFAAGAGRARLPDDGAGAVLQRRRTDPGRNWASRAGWPTISRRRPSSRPAFTCAERGGYNLSRICDPKLDRLIDRASGHAACGRRRRLGCRRPPRHLPGRGGAADPPSHRSARLRAGRQRQYPRAVVHVAGPDVGALSWLARRCARRCRMLVLAALAPVAADRDPHRRAERARRLEDRSRRGRAGRRALHGTQRDAIDAAARHVGQALTRRSSAGADARHPPPVAV